MPVSKKKKTAKTTAASAASKNLAAEGGIALHLSPEKLSEIFKATGGKAGAGPGGKPATINCGVVVCGG